MNDFIQQFSSGWNSTFSCIISLQTNIYPLFQPRQISIVTLIRIPKPNLKLTTCAFCLKCLFKEIRQQKQYWSLLIPWNVWGDQINPRLNENCLRNSWTEQVPINCRKSNISFVATATVEHLLKTNRSASDGWGGIVELSRF